MKIRISELVSLSQAREWPKGGDWETYYYQWTMDSPHMTMNSDPHLSSNQSENQTVASAAVSSQQPQLGRQLLVLLLTSLPPTSNLGPTIKAKYAPKPTT